MAKAGAERDHESREHLTREQFNAIVTAANDGDEAALVELRRILDGNPRIWRQVGDLGAHARKSLIDAISGKNSLLGESVPRVAAELGLSLTGSNATPLERLAADRVVMAWLAVQHLTVRCSSLEGGNRGWASFWMKSLDRAEKRYEAAIKTLQVIQALQSRLQFKPTSPVMNAEAGATAAPKTAAECGTVSPQDPPATNGQPPIRRSKVDRKSTNATSQTLAAKTGRPSAGAGPVRHDRRRGRDR